MVCVGGDDSVGNICEECCCCWKGRTAGDVNKVDPVDIMGTTETAGVDLNGLDEGLDSRCNPICPSVGCLEPGEVKGEAGEEGELLCLPVDIDKLGRCCNPAGDIIGAGAGVAGGDYPTKKESESFFQKEDDVKHLT